MAQEAVQIIKKAEEDAKNIIALAEKAALEIVDAAERNAVNSKKELIETLKYEYNKAIEEAKNDAQKISTERLSASLSDAEELAGRLMKNKDKAISEVLKKILEG